MFDKNDSGKNSRTDGYGSLPVESPASNVDDLGEYRRQHETLGWGELETVDSPLLPVEKLTPELIPPVLSGWINDIAHRLQAPPDFVATTAIVALASVIGTACTIKPKKKDDWLVIPNLWGACVGRPSVVLKTPSMKQPLEFLGRLQSIAGKAYETDKQAHKFDLKVAEAQDKSFEKSIGKAAASNNANELSRLRTAYTDSPEIEPPACRIFKTNETSVQSQTVLQKDNPRGILTYRDELVGLLSRWDKQGNEDERAYFLEGWNGDGSYTDFKIGRGLVEAKSICISLTGGIQPDKLAKYLRQSADGGNDGLVQRFQLAVYPDENTQWELVDKYPNNDEKTRVFNIFQTLSEMDFEQHGAEKTEFDKFPFLHFDAEGQSVFNSWITKLQHRIQSELDPLIGEHLGKYRSLMPTLALIFHLVDVADGSAVGPVTARCARLAAGWCEYLETHARRIYDYAASPDRDAAKILSERLDKLPEPFTAKDVYDKKWHLLKKKSEVENACDVLIDKNWLVMNEPAPSLGRPKLPTYSVNPAVMRKK